MMFQQQESTERLRRLEYHLLSTSSATDTLDGPQWEPHLRLNSLGPLPYSMANQGPVPYSPANQSPQNTAIRSPFVFQPQPFNTNGYGLVNNPNSAPVPSTSGDEQISNYAEQRESQAGGYTDQSQTSSCADQQDSRALSDAAFNRHIQALYNSNFPSDSGASSNSRVPRTSRPEPWSQEGLSQQLAELYGREAQQLLSNSDAPDDPVQIQTIQASDQRVPRLELNALLRHRQQLRWV